MMLSNPRNVVIVGGNGFIGSALCARLAQLRPVRGSSLIKVTVPVRRTINGQHLRILPNVTVVSGQNWNQIVAGHDVVVNLAGILHDTSNQQPWGPAFQATHVDTPGQLAAACVAEGVPHLIHISAVGASTTAGSAYLRSKGAGEAAIAYPSRLCSTVIRPAVIYGEHDRFVNQMASLIRLFPVLPIAQANARLQPVHIDNLVSVIQAAITGHPYLVGKITVVAGEDTFTLSSVIEQIGHAIGKKAWVIPLPEQIGNAQAWLLSRLPKPLLSMDNLLSLRDPGTVVPQKEARVWARTLGIAPIRFAVGLASIFHTPKPL